MSKTRKAVNWIILGIAIAINIFIIVNACLDGKTSSQESDTIAHAIADVINDVKPETVTQESFPAFAGVTRKVVGHFGLFTVDGIFSSICVYNFCRARLNKHYFLISISSGFGLLMAGLSELCQCFTIGRGPSFADIGIDFAGYFLGILLVLLVLVINHRKNQKQPANLG